MTSEQKKKHQLRNQLFDVNYNEQVFNKSPYRKGIYEYIIREFDIPENILSLPFPKSGISYEEYIYCRYLDGTLKHKTLGLSALQEPMLQICDFCGNPQHFRDECPFMF